MTGVFSVTVNVAGKAVTVEREVIDGVARVGSAWVP